MKKNVVLGWTILALCLTAAVAGCGGGSKSTASSSGASGEGAGSSAGQALARMEKNVKTLLGPRGTSVEEPKTSPVREGEHRKIEVVSCGQALGACAEATAGAMEAAKRLGWQATLFDAKLNLPTAATAIRQAIARGDEGIYIYYIDCTYIKTALEEAAKAEIPVVASDSRDCGETSPGAPELFSYAIHYNGDKTYTEFQNEFYGAVAEYSIVHFHGESSALAFIEENPTAKLAIEEYEKVYSECAACSIEIIEVPASAIGTRLQGIAEQELLKHPEVNTVIPYYESMSLEIYPAVRASGRSSEILTYLGEGGQPGLDLIREGANGFTNNDPVEWEGGWAGVDALGRIFLGQTPTAIGLGLRLVDSEHNLSENGPADSPIDFKAMYENAWKLR